MNIADLRQEYMRARLDETEVARDPFEQFNRWFDEAIKAEHSMLNAMTLATVNADGNVLISARDDTDLDLIAGTGALSKGLTGVGMSGLDVVMTNFNRYEDHMDAGLHSYRDALQAHHAAGRTVFTMKAVGEGRLPGTVLADQRVDLALADLQRRPAVRAHGTEPLVDPGHANRRGLPVVRIAHRLLGTEIRPATMSAFKASMRVRTASGISAMLFASYT